MLYAATGALSIIASEIRAVHGNRAARVHRNATTAEGGIGVKGHARGGKIVGIGHQHTATIFGTGFCVAENAVIHCHVIHGTSAAVRVHQEDSAGACCRIHLDTAKVDGQVVKNFQLALGQEYGSDPEEADSVTIIVTGSRVSAGCIAAGRDDGLAKTYITIGGTGGIISIVSGGIDHIGRCARGAGHDQAGQQRQEKG